MRTQNEDNELNKYHRGFDLKHPDLVLLIPNPLKGVKGTPRTKSLSVMHFLHNNIITPCNLSNFRFERRPTRRVSKNYV